jgi:nitroreductase
MTNFSDLAFSRRSIRKFQDRAILLSDIEAAIKVAGSAPSGCNSQCWKFIIIKDKAIMDKIVEAVMQKITEIITAQEVEVPEGYFAYKRKQDSFFTKAPVVVAVFMTRLWYYDRLLSLALKRQGLTDEEMMRFLANPDLLSIGAAVQNFLLAVHEKGYGACWMSEPAIAGAAINQILQVPLDQKFVSLIPIGFPAYTPREKKLKDFNEICLSI